jgi:UPF0042 nucleotide-binding protein
MSPPSDALVDSVDFSHLSTVVLIAGLSGAGKSTASRVLSDLGFYTIDNLPIALLPGFEALSRSTPDRFSKTCLLVDVESSEALDTFLSSLNKSKTPDSMRLIFLDSNTQTLVKRYSETRRPHPAFDAHRDKSLSDTIERERRRLTLLKERANFSVDTSSFSVHDLKRELRTIVESLDHEVSKTVRVNFLSFGFKHGTPFDCDLLVDVRFLPNPYFEDGLREKTGLDKEVQEFVLQKEQAKEFLRRYGALLNFLLPQYAYEGKAYVNIGVGCTGGKHRSVSIAESLAGSISDSSYLVSVKHRDISR